MRTTRWIPLVAVVLVACGSPSTGPGGSGNGSSPEDYEGAWQLIEGRGPDGEIEIIDNYDITLEIRDDSAGGRAACNSYGGDIEIDGHAFRATGYSMTDMACGQRGVMEAEAAYMSALAKADSIRREDDELVLEGPETLLRYEYVPPPPTAELIDTEWHLESLIYGGGPGGTASSAEPATLLLSGNGTLSGTTGCRSFKGKWIENGGEYAVPEMAMEGDCGEALREQDDHIVGVIGDGFKVEIDGQSLTVWDERGDLGLHYTTGE